MMVALLKMPTIGIDDSAAERRIFDRTPASGVVQGHRLDHTIEARRDPRLRMDLRDLSLGGLAAMSDRPLARGEQISLLFPKRGINAEWSAFGRVVRCQPTPFGYAIGVEFEPLLAA